MKICCKIILIAGFTSLGGCSTNATLVRSTPPNASVFIDGNLVGVTPFTIGQLKMETHKIHLEKKGYVPVDDYISVEHRHDMTALPSYWSSSDGRYTFKPVYEFTLQPVKNNLEPASPKQFMK
jgi:PEGA domain